jgi:hypothetical protein
MLFNQYCKRIAMQQGCTENPRNQLELMRSITAKAAPSQ